MMEGYWRHILSDETGLIRLFASNTDSILYQGDLVKSIILTGLYGNGSSNINQPIELQRVERFSEDLLNDDFRIIAHRGGGRTSDRLPFSENSIEMINYSQNLGATAIEIDVFLTKDSVPILIHDSELSLRLIQKSPLFGNISNYTYEQLHTYVKLIHGEEIPTLDDALHYVVYNTALSLVWLDIKDSESIRKVLPIQQTYLREAFELGRELQILIGVPDNNVYDALLSIPDYNQIPSLCELEPNIAIKAGSKAWGFRYTQGYQNQNVLVMHQAGLLCIPWTIDIPQYINEYISRGGSNSLLRYDGILTNYPTILAYYHYVRHN